MRELVIIVSRDAIASGRRLQHKVRYVALYKAAYPHSLTGRGYCGIPGYSFSFLWIFWAGSWGEESCLLFYSDSCSIVLPLCESDAASISNN